MIADSFNNRVRKVTPEGIITTIAGSGPSGPPLGQVSEGDGGPATAAFINSPTGVAVDQLGNLYIAEPESNRIRKVSITGIITTVVGSGACTLFEDLNLGLSGDGGPAATAQVACPWGVAVDGAGNLYFADNMNNRVRKITPEGIITTVAGSGSLKSVGGFSGDGGPATAASLWGPSAVAVDTSGNIYIADTGNERIRKVTPAGIITTVAGGGPSLPGGFGGDGGPATSATLNGPGGLTVDQEGNLYISDGGNNRVRMVTPAGSITTLAGDGLLGFSGDGGPAASAQLSGPRGLVMDAAGNLLIADDGNSRIRELSYGPAVLPNGVVNAASGRRKVRPSNYTREWFQIVPDHSCVRMRTPQRLRYKRARGAS
ncbi:MAG TPA: NHL repeat-containing protein [Bryobacteraceae bacterium]